MSCLLSFYVFFLLCVSAKPLAVLRQYSLLSFGNTHSTSRHIPCRFSALFFVSTLLLSSTQFRISTLISDFTYLKLKGLFLYLSFTLPVLLSLHIQNPQWKSFKYRQNFKSAPLSLLLKNRRFSYLPPFGAKVTIFCYLSLSLLSSRWSHLSLIRSVNYRRHLAQKSREETSFLFTNCTKLLLKSHRLSCLPPFRTEVTVL